ncbi:chromosomal replication initiator protein DnaA [Nisaea acidiphila]|uniref:Chromosomal replication initiator protein DnaA n=1 Tax=Nisaea acidiphila TaxID=1862145 RepID=A0A9J7B099_9PROT|nr:chromosomal replication initiator protein DnaA [Nisaea acidiphila]UUX52089.1 chromosomal replication initiator protein DnaA [Nisaea acidiphila]
MTADMSGDQELCWARVRGRLRTELGDAVFRNWLKPLTFEGIDEGTAIMRAPSPFVRDRVRSQYSDRLRAIWSVEHPDVKSIAIFAAGRGRTEPERAAEGADQPEAGIEAEPLPAPAVRSAPAAEERADFEAPLDPRFTFDNFVVGKPNELAFAAARRVAESESVPFNPLFLYGGVGLGKTHLMHAIAWHVRQKHPSRRVIYLSAEKFMYQFIRALRFRDTVAFKDQFRSVDLLMIDDVQFISGKDSTQEEFFHTFNALVDQNRQVVISADKSPTDLEGMEERLRSRLGWGLVADIHPTNYELRLGIMQSKAERLGVEMPEKVLEFLSHKISSNVRELEGALNRIVAHATLVGRDISLEMTQEVLADLLRANDRRVTVEEIQRQVANHFQIRLSEMHSARRSRAIARPRQVAMYLSKQLTSQSLPDIGRKFGGRDHTTVLHAVKKVEELRGQDKQFNDDVDLLRRMLES